MAGTSGSVIGSLAGTSGSVAGTSGSVIGSLAGTSGSVVGTSGSVVVRNLWLSSWPELVAQLSPELVAQLLPELVAQLLAGTTVGAQTPGLVARYLELVAQ